MDITEEGLRITFLNTDTIRRGDLGAIATKLHSVGIQNAEGENRMIMHKRGENAYIVLAPENIQMLYSMQLQSYIEEKQAQQAGLLFKLFKAQDYKLSAATKLNNHIGGAGGAPSFTKLEIEALTEAHVVRGDSHLRVTLL